jgi:hypothetical protein
VRQDLRRQQKGRSVSKPFEPGAEGLWRGVDAELYHSAPGISQSTLKAFMAAGSPKHFKALPPKVVTEDMEFGTLVHGAVLEPEKFDTLYYVRPDTYPSEAKGVITHKKWTGQAAYCKEWLAQHSDRIVIMATELEGVRNIQQTLTNHPFFGAALKDGEREISHFKRDEETGMLLKARTDLLTADMRTNLTVILDLKKVRSGFGNREDFGKQALDLGYHMQDASYLNVTGASRFIFVCFDDDAPYDVALHEMKPNFRALGHKEWRHQLKRFAECVKENEWPGYGLEITDLDMPGWGVRRDGEITDEDHRAWLAKVAKANAHE